MDHTRRRHELRSPAATARSGVRGVLAIGVAGHLQLERGVLDADRKVLGQTVLQLVEDLRRVPVEEAGVPPG